MRVLWHWYSMGPYHFSRMEALARRPEIELTVVESTSRDDHDWQRQSRLDLSLITLSSSPLDRGVVRATTSRFGEILNEIHPDIVIAPGYADPLTLRKLIAYKTSHPESSLLLWSETTEADHARKWFGESVKARLLSAFDGALVAGTCHSRYLQALGVPEEKIEVVGNCVDNSWYSERARQIRDGHPANALGLPDNYFLFVGRLIQEKNVRLLIDAYDQYRCQNGASAWDLVIVGAGPEEQTLRERAANIPTVHFVGSKQPKDLPAFYADAGCFVLPSSSEPWGLVVNEAMASGLPVIVSSKCGCAEDLVKHAENGFVFDPFDREGLASLMHSVSRASFNLSEIAERARHTIAGFTPENFAAKAARHFQRLRSTTINGRRGTPKTANALALLWEQVY